jgi:DNA-directed RNA polymerase subunit K/omega
MSDEEYYDDDAFSNPDEDYSVEDESEDGHSEEDEDAIEDIDDEILDLVSIADSTATSSLGALDVRHKQKTKHINKIYIVDPKDFVCSDVLSCFEYAEIIGTRATQLNAGGKIYVEYGNLEDSDMIAKWELYNRKCPLDIKREVGDDHVEIWNPNTMILPYRLERDVNAFSYLARGSAN